MAGSLPVERLEYAAEGLFRLGPSVQIIEPVELPALIGRLAEAVSALHMRHRAIGRPDLGRRHGRSLETRSRRRRFARAPPRRVAWPTGFHEGSARRKTAAATAQVHFPPGSPRVDAVIDVLSMMSCVCS
jgi:hypothetical protein